MTLTTLSSTLLHSQFKKGVIKHLKPSLKVINYPTKKPALLAYLFLITFSYLRKASIRSSNGGCDENNSATPLPLAIPNAIIDPSNCDG